MAATETSAKKKGPIINPAQCRCCRSIKKCRLLTAEYEFSGNREVYSDMFMDCFGLLLSHLDGDDKEDKDSCICATCVVRLRESFAFRQQVLQCEQMFLSAKLETKLDNDPNIPEPPRLDIHVEVKAEPVCESETDPAMDDRDDPDFPDIDSKVESADSADLNLLVPKKATRMRTRSATKTKHKTRGKKELLNSMQKIKAKLNKIMETEEPPQKKTKATQKKEKYVDQDHMTFTNAVTLVHNSYICPFLNRISNYYCYYCKDQFTNPSELREHTLTHDPETFESSMEYRKMPKIDITRIDCRLCAVKINDLTTLKSHLSTVHGKEIFPVTNEFLTFKLQTADIVVCTECNQTFPYFDMLKKHMNDHFGTFICDQCGACFLEQNSLRTHIKGHSKVEANFPCEICGKNLKSKYSRYLHVATVHEKKPTVNCYKCDASFLSYALRNKHLIEVHGDKRTFTCKLCDKVYNRRKTLMEHNRRNHLKVYRHQCDLCDQRFYLPSRLKEHMATHTGERNFRCEFCDKSYPRLQSLQEHVRSHSNERRYKCDICNTTFTQNGSLKNHMKSHHQGFDLEASFN